MKSLKFLTAITIAVLSVLLLKAQSENDNSELMHISETGRDGGSSVCSLPPDPGNCAFNCPRWYYDSSIQGCLPFTWGCCGGNANNFATYEACMNSCGSNSCPLYIDLGNKPINTANIQAKQQIIHSGTVSQNQDIQFEAGKRISLKSGFKTPANSKFKARIDNSCELVITDCANYSGCLAYTGATGQGDHDLFGEFVMPYNNCLLNNIPGTINNIPTIYNPVIDSTILGFDCGIPFYSGVILEETQVMPGIDSIEASIYLTFNSFYDGINIKLLATEFIINGESINCNDDESVGFYVKTDNSFINNISCTIYSTDFINVYVKDFSFSFTVGTVFNNQPPPYGYDIFAPFFSNSSTVRSESICECGWGQPCPEYIGTIAIILPIPD